MASKTIRTGAAILALTALEIVILVALGFSVGAAVFLSVLCGAALSLKAIRDGRIDWEREFRADLIASAFAAFRRFYDRRKLGRKSPSGGSTRLTLLPPRFR